MSARHRYARTLRTIATVALFFVAGSVAGCCQSGEATQVFDRGVADQGKSCERICRETIVTELQGETETFNRCEETVSEAGAPAVLCHYVVDVCTTELH